MRSATPQTQALAKPGRPSGLILFTTSRSFAAEAAGASLLIAATHFGMPVSTTHAITTSIMGVGCAKGFNALKLNVVERILWAWLLTIPASGIFAYGLVRTSRALGFIP